MANRYIRLYKGREGKSETIIGFSKSVTDTPDNNDFRAFMGERGYDVSEVEGLERPAGSLSLRHVGIQPPMTKDHVVEFGALLRRTVDVGHNEGFFMDNRLELPGESRMGGTTITRW